jgi:hypothetical protein
VELFVIGYLENHFLPKTGLRFDRKWVKVTQKWLDQKWVKQLEKSGMSIKL